MNCPHCGMPPLPDPACPECVPLVQGGQGRSDESVVGSGIVAFWCAALALLLMLASVIYKAVDP